MHENMCVHLHMFVCMYIEFVHVHYMQTFPDGTVAVRHPDGKVEQVCARECLSEVSRVEAEITS